MKKIIIIVLALLPLMAAAQQPIGQMPQNKTNVHDTTVSYAPYRAAADLSQELRRAGQHIINSVLLEVAGVAAFAISSEVSKKDSEAGNLIMAIGGGCAIIGIIMLANGGMDLKSASKAAARVHPIPNGVSIDLN